MKKSTRIGGEHDLPPVLLIRVRRGLVHELRSTHTVHVLIEDWDVEGSDSGERPSLQVERLQGDPGTEWVRACRRHIAETCEHGGPA